MAYNVVEAIAAITFGVKADSVALFGFGLDSVIECAAASVMLWRLRVEARGESRDVVAGAERRVRRFIGGTFIALAGYVLVQSAFDVLHAAHPDRSVAGIVIAVASLIIMPSIAVLKLRAATALGSASLRAEARETLVCSYLSFTLLLGLVFNATLGWWWADPVAAVLMVPWVVKEGIEGLQGRDCCNDSPVLPRDPMALNRAEQEER